MYPVWGHGKRLLCTCREHPRQVVALAAMPDCQRFLSSAAMYPMGTLGWSSDIRVWRYDAPTRPGAPCSRHGGLMCTLVKSIPRMHRGTVWCLVALPDDVHAISGGEDGKIKLFDVSNGAVLRRFAQQHECAMKSLALLPDGVRFVSGSKDGVVCVLEHGLAPRAQQ